LYIKTPNPIKRRGAGNCRKSSAMTGGSQQAGKHKKFHMRESLRPEVGGGQGLKMREEGQTFFREGGIHSRQKKEGGQSFRSSLTKIVKTSTSGEKKGVRKRNRAGKQDGGEGTLSLVRWGKRGKKEKQTEREDLEPCGRITKGKKSPGAAVTKEERQRRRTKKGPGRKIRRHSYRFNESL